VFVDPAIVMVVKNAPLNAISSQEESYADNPANPVLALFFTFRFTVIKLVVVAVTVTITCLYVNPLCVIGLPETLA
jgi:hypothetical protein